MEGRRKGQKQYGSGDEEDGKLNRSRRSISETGSRPGRSALKSFYNDVRTEMRKVTAPSWKEVQATTAVVVITVFIFGVYFFMIDNMIQKGVTFLYSYFGH